jgi:ribosomal peptide maturation radical SAM protein 1
MFRVLLIHMPFADINRPSLGISLLKAGLEREGVACDVAYINLRFANYIGVSKYVQIDGFAGSPQLGEWIFAESLFGDTIPGIQLYYDKVLRPAMREPFGTDEVAFRRTIDDRELVSGLGLLRTNASEFLEECVQSYDWPKYKIIGFTTTFQQNTPALGLAKVIKAKYPHVLIAFGGANCEGEMGVTMHRLFPFLDIVCSGEGDHSFVRFCIAAAKGDIPTGISGIIQRLDGETVVPRDLTNPIQEMDALPIPDYTDFFVERASLGWTNSDVTLPVESSRGCWWGRKAHCTFCGLNGTTMNFRTKSPDRFLNELDLLIKRHGIYDFSAADNIIDMRYFDSVLPNLAMKGRDVRLFYETKANLQRGHVRMLRESGVTHIQPGIESLSTAVLRLMRKGVHAYQNIRLLRLCAEYLVRPSWNILGGFPGEDPEEYSRQAKLIPLLEHLTPPVWVGTVRLDRFSPLFDYSEKFGVRNVRPSRAYKYVYPFEDADMSHLGYFFDFDYLDGRDPLSYMSELRDAAARWREANALDTLIYLDDGEVLTMADKRPSNVVPLHVLRGVDRFVYLRCEDGTSFGRIRQAMAEAYPPDALDSKLEAALNSLISARLIIEIDDYYVSLGIAGNYRLERLVHHLMTKSPPPEDLKQAIRRLFDLHTERFSRYLIDSLSKKHYAEV